jgi:hypothetical protein
MPCWTVQTSTLKLENADEALLRAALEELGFANVMFNNLGARMTADRFRDGTSVRLLHDGGVQVNLSAAAVRSGVNAQQLGNEISRAYSRKVVQSTAKRLGWAMTETAEGEFQVTRRGM